MKKIYLFISAVLFVTVSLAGNLKPIAQKIYERKVEKRIFTDVRLFDITSASQERGSELKNVVKGSTIFEFRSQDARSVLTVKPDNIHFIIPTASGVNLELELFKTTFTTPDFSVVASNSNGKAIPYEGGVHYWGIVKGDNSSIASISIFDNEVMGMISSPTGGNIILGKLEHDTQDMHILYNEHDLVAPPLARCNTPESLTGYSGNDLNRSGASTLSTNCIRLYWEVNYDLYQNKGSLTAVTNYVTGLFNQSAVLYSNDSIPVTLGQVYVWTTASPYTQTSTSALLSQFQATRTSFNGDLGMLIGLVGNGGIAYVNGLCGGNQIYSEGYAGISTYFNTVPTYSWSVEVVTHEQGHLMGSQHTHACAWNGNNTAIDGCGPAAGYAYEGSCTGAPVPSGGGTIMSYCHLTGVGINFSLGFGPQPRAVILNRYNNALCLTSCSGTTCNVPTGLTSSSVTSSAATVSWTAVSGASGYSVRYRISGTTTWTTVSTASASYNATGLTAGSVYEWQVQTICSGGSSAFTSSTNFTTSSVPCNVPTGMNTTAVSTSSATFNWTAVSGATSYSISYRLTGTTGWTTSSTASVFYNASGLTANSTYEWQVSTICSGGSSAFTSSTNFTTSSVPCNVPTGMNTTAVSTSSATFNWTAVSGATSYSISYRLTGTTGWTTSSTASVFYNASGLTANSIYEWQVSTTCSGGSSAFTGSVTFTTSSPACGVPSGLTTLNITGTSATLSWTSITGALSYNINWKSSAATIWNNVSTVTSSTYNLPGLASCTGYQFRIQTVCSGGTSAFSNILTFTTTGCQVTYCTSKGSTTGYEYINNVSLGTINNLSGDNAGYGNFISLSTNLVGGSSNTISFTPGFHGASYLEYWTAWIDYNHNGNFTDVGEKVIMTNGTGLVSSTFTVPLTALNGSTRMRIQMQYNAQQNNPCALFTYGEVEDYSVVVNGNSQSPAVSQDGILKDSEIASELVIYPNPAKDYLTAEFRNIVYGNVKIKVYNIIGKQMMYLENTFQEGTNNFSLNTSVLINGLYILELEINGKINRQRFMISK